MAARPPSSQGGYNRPKVTMPTKKGPAPAPRASGGSRRSGDNSRIQDRRTAGQRDLSHFAEKFKDSPLNPKRAAPGIDKTAKVKVPYARVKLPPSKRYEWSPSDKVAGYGTNAKGGEWRNRQTGKVVATSKSPTARPKKVTPQPTIKSSPTKAYYR